MIKLAKSKWFRRKVFYYSFFAFLFMCFVVFLRGFTSDVLDQVTIYKIIKGVSIAIPISLLIGMNLAYKRLKEFGAKHAGCKKSKS